MVKKKNNTNAEDAAPIAEPIEATVAESEEKSFENDSIQPEIKDAETQMEDSNEEEKVEDNIVESAAPSTTEIPDKALAYLKRHPEDKEVYIDKLGGVFPANTPKVFVKDAVLYQNPYFKQ